MLTAGIDLAAQPKRTGVVVLDWSGDVPRVTHAAAGATDEHLRDVVRAVAAAGGHVGIDCPLGWPRAFRAFVDAHATGRRLPVDGPDTASLRMRATDLHLRAELGIVPLSVSTDRLGITAMRAAWLLQALAADGVDVDRVGRGAVSEVYPAAARRVWGLPKGQVLDAVRAQLPLDVPDDGALKDEHVFDGLLAALVARAVTLGQTHGCPPHLEELAAEEGWLHVPSGRLDDLR